MLDIFINRRVCNQTVIYSKLTVIGDCSCLQISQDKNQKNKADINSHLSHCLHISLTPPMLRSTLHQHVLTFD